MTPSIPRLLLAAVLLGSSPAFGEDFEARLLYPDGRAAAGFRILVVGRPGRREHRPRRFLPPPAGAGGAVPAARCRSGRRGLVADRDRERAGGRVDLVVTPLARDTVTVLSGVSPGLDLLPAAAASVVTAEALEQRPPQRLVDSLDSVAGVSKLGDGADSVPVLRGLARGRTLVLVDGVRVTTERRAGPSATFLAPAALAAVEVVRGPGSVLYGSDAFGGVVNAVTRDPDPGPASLGWTLDRWSGGWNEWSGSARATTGVGEGGIGAEVHFASATDSRGGDGETIENSSFRSHGAAVTWASPWGRGQARASVAFERVADLGKAAVDSLEVRSIYPREDWDRVRAAWVGSGERGLGSARREPGVRPLPRAAAPRSRGDARHAAPARHLGHDGAGRVPAPGGRKTGGGREAAARPGSLLAAGPRRDRRQLRLRAGSGRVRARRRSTRP